MRVCVCFSVFAIFVILCTDLRLIFQQCPTSGLSIDDPRLFLIFSSISSRHHSSIPRLRSHMTSGNYTRSKISSVTPPPPQRPWNLILSLYPFHPVNFTRFEFVCFMPRYTMHSNITFEYALWQEIAIFLFSLKISSVHHPWVLAWLRTRLLDNFA